MYTENDSYTKFRKEASDSLQNSISRFVEYQKLALEILHEVDVVCRNNYIDYFLAYGSLLGAVRDKGMIPWDYDVDVWVRGRDIFTLIDALNKDLSDGYYFVCRYYNKEHRHFMMRVGKKGISTEILHVDIFWLWEAGNDISQIKHCHSVLEKYRNYAFWKLCDSQYLISDGSSWVKRAIKIKRFFYKLIPIYILDHIYTSQIKKLKRAGIYLSDEYQIFLSKDFEYKTEILLNDGNKYFIPKGYENILHQEYGNYRIYLPIEKRISEMMNSLERLIHNQ